MGAAYELAGLRDKTRYKRWEKLQTAVSVKLTRDENSSAAHCNNACSLGESGHLCEFPYSQKTFKRIQNAPNEGGMFCNTCRDIVRVCHRSMSSSRVTWFQDGENTPGYNMDWLKLEVGEGGYREPR